MLLYAIVLTVVLCPCPFLFIKMHPVGFEPTHLSIAELKSAPLDHSGTNASCLYFSFFFPLLPQLDCLFILSFIYSLFFMFFPYFLLYSFLYIIYIIYVLTYKNYMEMRGIDPLAPRMRNECSTIWATSPYSSFYIYILVLFKCLYFWQKCIRWGSNPRIFR